MHPSVSPFMLWNRSCVAVLAMASLLGWTAAARSENEANADIAAMEVMREVQLDAAAKPLKDLENKYREALEKKRKSAQESGNLEYVVAAAAELDLLAKGDDADSPPRQPDLAKLRVIYQEQKAKLIPQVETAVLAVNRDFARDMNKLVADLTKAGKTDEALQVKENLDSFIKEHQSKRQEAVAAKAAPAETPENAADETPKGIHALEKLLMSGAWSWHVDNPDTPPFGSIRFKEDGKISGVTWLTGWEALDSSKFKVIFQNNPDNNWVFKLAKNRETAKTIEINGSVKGEKALKHIKD